MVMCSHVLSCVDTYGHVWSNTQVVFWSKKFEVKIPVKSGVCGEERWVNSLSYAKPI